MALKGAREPVQGVKGAKARLRLPKTPRQPETSETVELGEEYLRKRNKILDVKFKRESMNLGLDRGQLIERARARTYNPITMLPNAHLTSPSAAR